MISICVHANHFAKDMMLEGDKKYGATRYGANQTDFWSTLKKNCKIAVVI